MERRRRDEREQVPPSPLPSEHGLRSVMNRKTSTSTFRSRRLSAGYETFVYRCQPEPLCSGLRGWEARVRAVMVMLLLHSIPSPRPRSIVMATHGIVATSHPLAAQIGLEVLRK